MEGLIGSMEKRMLGFNINFVPIGCNHQVDHSLRQHRDPYTIGNYFDR